MQIPLKIRVTEFGASNWRTHYVDISDLVVVVLRLVVYTITGTNPQIAVQLETSDDLETWLLVGSEINLTAAGQVATTNNLTGAQLGRFVRAKVTLSGSNPLVNYSLYLNAHASS